MLRPLRSEQRGDATVEAVLAFPVLLLLVMLVIQFGLYFHASHAAEAAAQEGVRAARVLGGSAADGERTAEQFMADSVPTLVEGVAIDATRTTEQARVVVSGTVHSIVPGLHLDVRAEAASPVERFRPDTP